MFMSGTLDEYIRLLKNRTSTPSSDMIRNYYAREHGNAPYVSSINKRMLSLINNFALFTSESSGKTTIKFYQTQYLRYLWLAVATCNAYIQAKFNFYQQDVLLSVVTMADIEINLENEEWKQYKVQFNKTYADEKEETERYKLFIGTKKTIEEHNEKYKKGEVTFEMGINQFADRRPDEVVCCGVRKKN